MGHVGHISSIDQNGQFDPSRSYDPTCSIPSVQDEEEPGNLQHGFLSQWRVSKGGDTQTPSLRNLDTKIAEQCFNADLNTRLHQAADCGDTAAVSEALREGADVNYADEEGRSPLVWAAKNGHSGCVSFLLTWRCNIDHVTRHGATALGLASWRGFPDVMQLLLAARANTEATSKTPLMWAAESGHVEPVKLLIKWNCSINAADCQITPAIVLAAQKGHADVVEILAKSKAKSITLVRSLSNAARVGHANVVTLLLNCQVDPAAADLHGVSPLMWAASRGHVDIVKEIVSFRVPVDAVMEDGETAQMMAARRNHATIVKFLVRSGASLYPALELLNNGAAYARLGPAVSLGITELKGASLEGFARRLQLPVVAAIISTDGEAGTQLLEGLFMEHDMLIAGDHAIHTIDSSYLKSHCATLVDSIELASDGTAIISPELCEHFAPQTQWNYISVPPKKVKFFRCVLPRVWDVQVIHAIGMTKGSSIFHCVGCHAIIHHAWNQVFLVHLLHIAFKITTIICLVFVAVSLSSSLADDDVALVPFGPRCILSVVWCVQGIEWLHQVIRGWNFRKHPGFCVPSVFYTALTLHLAGELTLMEGRLVGLNPYTATLFRLEVAAACACEWGILTQAQFMFRVVGPQSIPILVAMRNIRAFSGIMMMILLACLHAYSALTNTHIGKAFLMIWSLGLLGEIDLDQFEAEAGMPNYQLIPLDLLFLGISFVFTVLLMNIFIGVVGNTYNNAVRDSEAAFLRSRAQTCCLLMLSPFFIPFQRMYEARIQSGVGLLWVCHRLEELTPIPSE